MVASTAQPRSPERDPFRATHLAPTGRLWRLTDDEVSIFRDGVWRDAFGDPESAAWVRSLDEPGEVLYLRPFTLDLGSGEPAPRSLSFEEVSARSSALCDRLRGDRDRVHEFLGWLGAAAPDVFEQILNEMDESDAAERADQHAAGNPWQKG